MDGRYLVGIVVRNGHNIEISHVEMFGFPVAMGISADTIFNSILNNNYIHDFGNNYASWPNPGALQSTAIEIDGDRVPVPTGSQSSDSLQITGNIISNIILGPNINIEPDEETDGINSKYGTHFNVSYNNIANVGEAIDNQTSESVFVGNDISNTHNACIKNVYGASYNIFSGNTMAHCGQFGFGLSSFTNGDLQFNTFVGNTIYDIDPTNNWRSHGNPTASIIIDRGTPSTYYVKNNIMLDNTINPGANGQYAYADKTNSGNMGNKLIGNSLSGSSGTYYDPSNQTYKQQVQPTLTNLGDFSTGPWAPGLAGSTAAGTIAYTMQSGFYEKLGSEMLVNFYITTSSISGATGDMVLTGLPVPSSATAYGSCSFANMVGVSFDTGYTQITGLVSHNDVKINLREIGSASPVQDLGTSKVNSATTLTGTCVIPL